MSNIKHMMGLNFYWCVCPHGLQSTGVPVMNPPVLPITMKQIYAQEIKIRQTIHRKLHLAIFFNF